MAQFTLEDFYAVVNTVGGYHSNALRNTDHDCTAHSEETDGECVGCDRNFVAQWSR
jgi:hypothetical protein